MVLGQAAAAAQGDGVAAFVGPEKLSVHVETRIFLQGQDLADAGVHGDVGRAGVISSAGAIDDARVVAFDVTAVEAAFVVEAVVPISTDEDAAAQVLMFPITAGAAVEEGRVIAFTVFDEGHDRVDVVLALETTDEADIDVEAVAAHVRAGLMLQGFSAHDGIRSEAGHGVHVEFHS